MNRYVLLEPAGTNLLNLETKPKAIYISEYYFWITDVALVDKDVYVSCKLAFVKIVVMVVIGVMVACNMIQNSSDAISTPWNFSSERTLNLF